MNLLQALDLSSSDRIAFIGSGGKTTAIFQIARQFGQKVIVTTTTHFGEQEIGLADDHCFVHKESDLIKIPFNNLGNIILITGPKNGAGKLIGLATTMVKKLFEIATELDCPILIEADGSRRKPLKAFASHEPVIPEGLSHIIVVAGISAIGGSLAESIVHRPETFSRQTSVPIGSPITLNSMATILTPPFGLLQEIPAEIELYLILNQADTPNDCVQAGKLSNILIKSYSKIAVTSLKYGENVISCKRSIAVIILAAGGSKRLGKPKQLLHWRNKTFIESIMDTVALTDLYPVVVVTGSFHDEVAKILEGQDLIIFENTEWKNGQSTSMKSGIKALLQSSKRFDGVLFLLVDQPQLSPSYLNSLVESTYTSASKVVAPMVDGKRSTPVYFNKTTFQVLKTIDGDQGGRAIFSKYPPKYIEWLDTTMGLDCDEYKDLQTLRLIE